MGRIKDALKNGLKFLADVNRGFFEGARENSIRIVRKDALDGNDYFMLLCFRTSWAYPPRFLLYAGAFALHGEGVGGLGVADGG